VLLQCRNVRKKAVSVHSKLVVGAQKSLAQLLADIDDIEGQEVNKIQRMIEGQTNMQLGYIFVLFYIIIIIIVVVVVVYCYSRDTPIDTCLYGV